MRKTVLLASIMIIFAIIFPQRGRTEDLLSIYRQAMTSDPQYLEAKAGIPDAEEQIAQAVRNLLFTTTLSLSDTETRDEVDNSNSSSRGYTLSITQPIMRWDRWLSLKQSKIRLKKEEARLEEASQRLLVRVASAYFGILEALDEQEYNHKTVLASKEQLALSKQRFKQGLTRITDVEETQASLDLAIANEISANIKLDESYEVLKEITGIRHKDLAPLQADIPTQIPDPPDPELWIKAALAKNLKLVAARYDEDVAKEDVEVERARGFFPTVEVVGSKIYNYNSNSTPSLSRSSAVRIQLDIPLDATGMTLSKMRQKSAALKKIQQQIEQRERSTKRSVLNSFRAIKQGVHRIKAIRDTLISSNRALKATVVGFNAGTRISTEVIAGKSQAYRAEKNYSVARYDFLLESLKLKEATGTLSVEDLQTINQLLLGSVTHKTAPPPLTNKPEAPISTVNDSPKDNQTPSSIPQVHIKAQPKTQQQLMRVTAISGAKIRKTASIKAKIVTILPHGAVVKLLGNKKSWAKVALISGEKSGYIKKRLIAIYKPIPAGWFQVVPTKGVKLHSGPSKNTNVIMNVKNGILVQGVEEQNGWMSVIIPNIGIKGYIPRSLLQDSSVK
ncbi:MAG: TolC family outer membrane protein [Magnetococcales bacterium]|nr:TolC family outer membrane protein [Magnetococcales bacterium]